MKTHLELDREVALAKDEALVLYICQRLADNEDFGGVKLNKALWFTDIASFMQKGHYISSFDYIKQKAGPTPDGRFLSIKRRLTRDGKLREEQVDYFFYTLKKPVALVEPDTSLFASDELSIINKSIDFVRKYSASALSEFTHNLGWERTELMAPVGPNTYLLTNEALSTEELSFFKEESMKYQS